MMGKADSVSKSTTKAVTDKAKMYGETVQCVASQLTTPKGTRAPLRFIDLRGKGRGRRTRPFAATLRQARLLAVRADQPTLKLRRTRAFLTTTLPKVIRRRLDKGLLMSSRHIFGRDAVGLVFGNVNHSRVLTGGLDCSGGQLYPAGRASYSSTTRNTGKV